MDSIKYISILLLSISISCYSVGDKNEVNLQNEVLVDTVEKPKVDKIAKHAPMSFEDVQVLTARKVRDPHSNYFKEYKALCKDWKPSKAVITEIFSNSKIIDGHEYHYYYEILPCYVIGRLIINCDITAKYELNAGGSAILLLPDTAYFVGYYGNEHFLTYRAEY